MKTVITRQEEPTVQARHTEEHKYYLLTAPKCEPHFLRYEKEGWIFRSVKNRGGHSGYHSTIEKAIVHATSIIEDQTVLEFDTFAELARYVASMGNL